MGSKVNQATVKLRKVLATVRDTEIAELSTPAAIKEDLIFSLSQNKRSFTRADVSALRKYLREADEILEDAELCEDHPIVQKWRIFWDAANDKINDLEQMILNEN